MSSGKPTKDAVEALLKKSPYSSSNLETLEAYVDAQASGEALYFMDANRSLLKLYQFAPQNIKEDKVAVILLLALLEFPSTDLLALRYLVPERVQKADACDAILSCSALLDACKFTEFWPAYMGLGGNNDIKTIVQASKEKMQRAVVGVLALTYRTASLSKVLECTNMTSADDLTKLKHPCIESVSGDKVLFVATADNTKRTRVFQEGVNFSAISAMMAKVSSE
jgi:CSN8/PSMD8/EIF3K family